MTDAIAAFADAPADPAAAQALAREDKAALLALVDALVGAGKRAHLEALGAAAAVPKDVQKAARKAAYKLKSAGVDAPPAPRGAPAIDLSVRVNLEDIALGTAPGLRGQCWLVLGDLPGVSPVEVSVAAGGTVREISLLEGIAAGRLRRFARDARAEHAEGPLPVLLDAAAAAAYVDDLAELIAASGAEPPPRWAHALAWRDRALQHGAAPGRRARTALAAQLADIDINLTRRSERLLKVREGGPVVPPDPTVDAMFDQVNAAAHSDLELTEAQFTDRLAGLADSAADAWLGDPRERTKLAAWLDGTATLVLASGQPEAALQYLYVADQLRGGDKLPHEIGLVGHAFRDLIDYPAAWAHHESFKRGEDHHHHGHGHDHGHDHGDAAPGSRLIEP